MTQRLFAVAWKPAWSWWEREQKELRGLGAELASCSGRGGAGTHLSPPPPTTARGQARPRTALRLSEPFPLPSAEGEWGLRATPNGPETKDSQGVGTIFILKRLPQSTCRWTGCPGKVCIPAVAGCSVRPPRSPGAASGLIGALYGYPLCPAHIPELRLLGRPVPQPGWRGSSPGSGRRASGPGLQSAWRAVCGGAHDLPRAGTLMVPGWSVNPGGCLCPFQKHRDLGLGGSVQEGLQGVRGKSPA